MKAHTVKSNAKRAARKLAEKYPGLFEVTEPHMAVGGGWFAAVLFAANVGLEARPAEVLAECVFDNVDDPSAIVTASLVGLAGVPPVTPAPTKPKPADLPRPPAPSADIFAVIDAKFAANREALSSFKPGDRVEFDQPGTYTNKDGSKREGRLVVGVIVKVLDKEQGALKVVEDSGTDWRVGASVLRSAAVEVVTVGVDVQADRLGVEVVGWGRDHPHPSPSTEGCVGDVLAQHPDSTIETSLATGEIKINETAKTVAAVKALPPPVKSTPEEIAARRAERRARMDAEKAAGIRDARGNLKPTGKPARPETKAALIIRLVNRPKGAAMEELMGATGWQRHTLRGYIGGTLRKNGHRIVAARAKGGEPTRYTIAPVELAEPVS